MKKLNVILLVGGKNTRLSNANNKDSNIPKSLVKINSKILLFHSMMNYINHDFYNFILPIGFYKESFISFFKNKKKIYDKKCKIFFNHKEYLKYKNSKHKVIKILLINTGKKYNKAERIVKVLNKLKLNEFALSYGDGVGNVNLTKLYMMHLKSTDIMSVASMRPKSQYGHFVFNGKNNQAVDFIEKPSIAEWANIGYFFFKKEAIKYLKKYQKQDLEIGVMKKIVRKNKLLVYKHTGFWKSVDTLKDSIELSRILKNVKK